MTKMIAIQIERRALRMDFFNASSACLNSSDSLKSFSLLYTAKLRKRMVILGMTPWMRLCQVFVTTKYVKFSLFHSLKGNIKTMARITMMMTVHLNGNLSVFLKGYNSLPLLCLKQLWTYLFLHKTRYRSRVMVVMVKTLQLKARLKTNKKMTTGPLMK